MSIPLVHRSTLGVIMLRALVLTALLVLPLSTSLGPGVTSFQKESGWISTCDGIGCHGRAVECATYSTSSPGGPVTHYCYRDMFDDS